MEHALRLQSIGHTGRKHHPQGSVDKQHRPAVNSYGSQAECRECLSDRQKSKHAVSQQAREEPTVNNDVHSSCCSCRGRRTAHAFWTEKTSPGQWPSGLQPACTARCRCCLCPCLTATNNVAYCPLGADAALDKPLIGSQMDTLSHIHKWLPRQQVSGLPSQCALKAQAAGHAAWAASAP